MKILNLTLKKEWFELIKSGVKTEEYREIKSYWEKRLLQCNKDLKTKNSKHQCMKQQCSRCILESGGGEFLKYDYIKFINGYGADKPNFTIECKGIKIGTAVPEWSGNWKGNVFIIELGEIIKGDV